MQFPKLFPEQLGSVSRAIFLSLPGLEALCDPLNPVRRTLGPGKPWEALGVTPWEGPPGMDPWRNLLLGEGSQTPISPAPPTARPAK